MSEKAKFFSITPIAAKGGNGIGSIEVGLGTSDTDEVQQLIRLGNFLERGGKISEIKFKSLDGAGILQFSVEAPSK